MEIEEHRSVGYLVNLCARLFAQRMSESLARLDVTPAYLPALVILSRAGSLTLGELAAHASTEQPTMTRTLSRMVRDGLVVRSVDPADGRRTTIRLTERGASIVPEVLAIAAVVNREAIHDLDIPNEEAFMDQLAALADNLRRRDAIAHAVAVDRDR